MRAAAPLVLARWLGPWARQDASPPGVTRETLTWGAISSHVYAPAGQRTFGTYVIAPGLDHLGPDDPRMDRFCRVLAASGLLVVAPRLPDFLGLRISPRTTEDLAVAFDGAERLAAEKAHAAPPALFAISFGSRPAIALAASATHRARIGRLVLFGGFVDFEATVRFAVDATREGARADPLNAPVVYLNLLPWLPFEGDREAVARAWRLAVERTWGRAELKVGRARAPILEDIARTLGPRERDLFLVGCGLQEGTREMLEEGLAAAQAENAFGWADPRADLGRVAAPVVVIHGRDDDVIPWQAAEEIAAALAPGHPSKVLVTGMAAHTGTALPPLTAMVNEAITMGGVVRAMAEAPAARLGVRDVFGLRPLAPALGAAARALGGAGGAPTRFGLSSLRILKPRISLPTWLGFRRADRRLPVYNLFNRVPAPRDEGYSVRVTYARDFRGGRFTYDGHLGTDFAVPVGTPIVAAAPGVVLRVANDFDRGGLKVCVDHGGGLVTTSNHLARALVRPGDRVRRGQRLGLSGASGMEFVLVFPWVAPHLHFNVWLGGEPADPFAVDGERALWRTGNEPVPCQDGDLGDDAFEPSAFSEAGVSAAVEACRDPTLRAGMRAIEDLARRGAEVLFQRNYHAQIFDAFPYLYEQPSPRRPVLDLPFLRASATGIAF